jgi:hypothetical protein
MLCRRLHYPRDCAALFFGMGRGCAPQESDDTEVVPPETFMESGAEASLKYLEGNALSAAVCLVQATPCLQE